LFIREFDLVETKEMAPLQHLTDKINGQIMAKNETKVFFVTNNALLNIIFLG
jgi:hypothetical protein